MDSKVSIAVDDFGLTPEANTGILKAVKTGRVSRVGVMIDGSWSDSEKQQILRAGLRLDLHLDFDNPILERKDLKEGVFHRTLTFLGRYVSGKITARKVELVWERQIGEFRRIFGRVPDGINSHQHVHYFPIYFAVVVRLAKKHSIKYIRFGSRSICQSRDLVSIMLRFLRLVNLKRFKASGLDTSDCLVSYEWIPKPAEFFRRPPVGTTELIMHPERPEELRALCGEIER